MMPTALNACFHHIGRVFVARPLQFLDVFAIGDALTMLRQARPKDVCDEDDVGLFTNRTSGLRWFAQMFCGANEFWVGVAYRFTTDSSALHFVDQCATRQLMVDDSDVTSQHVDGETHEPSR